MVRNSSQPAHSPIASLDGLPPIKVVGVGGGGSNSVDRMIQERLFGVEFVAVNTDAQALLRSQAPARIRIGDKMTKGLGAGGDPAVGSRAAEESHDELAEAVRGAEMVFITAGMGGGTGTGAAPVVAEMARQAGALTVAVVTRPFGFEGARRRRQAEEGIEKLREKVDTLIVIPNDRLLSVCDQRVTMQQAFREADSVLYQGIRGISEMITRPGLINVDFADVKRIMQGAGPALLAIGRGHGENRAVEAAKQAIASPLLDQSIQGARGVLFNVSGPEDVLLFEVNMAAQVINEVVDPEAEIIFGAVLDDAMGEEVQITVIATGFDTAQPEPHGRRQAPMQTVYYTQEPRQNFQQPPYQPPAYQQQPMPPMPPMHGYDDRPAPGPRQYRLPQEPPANGNGHDEELPAFLRRTMQR